jgi:putative ABC transport system permease protein
MRPFAFAARSLIRQPARSGLGVLGVAAVGALLFDMLLLSRGLVVSFRHLLGAFGFDVRVMSSESFMGPPLTDVRETVAALRGLPEIAEVVPLRVGRAQIPAGGEHALPLTLIAADPGQRRQWTVQEGRDLSAEQGGAEPQALVNRSLAARLRLRPGSELRVRGPCRGDSAALAPLRFRVVGIAAFPYEESSELIAALTLSGYRRACPEQAEDEANLLLVASREGASPEAAVAAIRRARPGLNAFTNEQILARFQQVEFSYFRQISAVLAALTLFFGGLLITVLLTVSVNQRLGEIAALRALGFSRKRVLADVLCQSALLVGSGGALALPLGALLASWLDRLLKAMPGVPVELHFFAFEPRALWLHVSLLSGTALLAALYPMRLVARLNIAATLRDEVVS